VPRPEELWPIDPHRQFDLAMLAEVPPRALRTGADGDAELVWRGESAAWHNSLFVYRIDAAGRLVDVRPVWADASGALYDPARARDLDGRGTLHDGDSVRLSDVYGGPLPPGTRFGLLLVADGARRIPEDAFRTGNWGLVDAASGGLPGPDTRAQDVRLVHTGPGGDLVLDRGLWFSTDPGGDGGPSNPLNADGVEHVVWAEMPDGGVRLAFEDLDTRAYGIPARNFIDLVLDVRTAPLAARTCPLDLDAAHLAGGVGSLAKGTEAGARFGSVLAFGDFDGDGLVDLAVGEPYAADGAGAVTVIYGLDGRPEVLAGSRSVRIVGDAAGDRLGISLAAGDLDGDGRDELVVGAIGVDGGGADSGAVYVLDAEALAAGPVGVVPGIRLDGLSAGDELGRSVAAGMDVNGDGFADLVVGARLAEADDARYSGGLSYVIFGGAAMAGDLAALDGTNGFRMEGRGRFDQSGRSVALVGDLNGDGLADLAVGAPDADPRGRENAGEVYVIFGHTGGFAASLDLGTLDGSNGLVVEGPNPGAFAGFAVSPAGDVNGDGFDDLLIGAYGTLSGGPAGAGGAWIVFGGPNLPGRLDLAALAPEDGIALPGVLAASGTGRAVAAAGDVNGDGFDDVLVGARYADLADGGEGLVYLVFGRDDGPGTVDLATLDADGAGCILRGTAADVYAGFALAGARDIDGDGFADVAVGAPSPPESADPGTVYVVYGTGEPITPFPAPAPTPGPLLVAEAFTATRSPFDAVKAPNEHGKTPAGESAFAPAGGKEAANGVPAAGAAGDPPPGPAEDPLFGRLLSIAAHALIDAQLEILSLAHPGLDPVGAWERLAGGANDRGESYWG